MNLNKITRQLPSGWAEEAEAMSEEELRSVIVDSNNNIRISQQEMEENQGFLSAKEAYKEARGPFSDAVKSQKAKIAFALHLLDSKGKL